MSDPYDEFSDYFEAVVLHCKVEGCSWQRFIDWSDLGSDAGGESEARRLFMEHYNEVHGGIRGENQ